MASALLAAAKARDRLGMAQIGARFPNPLANSIQETHMGPSRQLLSPNERLLSHFSPS